MRAALLGRWAGAQCQGNHAWSWVHDSCSLQAILCPLCSGRLTPMSYVALLPAGFWCSGANRRTHGRPPESHLRYSQEEGEALQPAASLDHSVSLYPQPQIQAGDPSPAATAAPPAPSGRAALPLPQLFPGLLCPTWVPSALLTPLQRALHPIKRASEAVGVPDPSGLDIGGLGGIPAGVRWRRGLRTEAPAGCACGLEKRRKALWGSKSSCGCTEAGM